MTFSPGCLPLDDVVDLHDLWWTGELDAARGEDRHQALTERLELLLRVPDLADPEAATGTESDVVVEPVRRELARCLYGGHRLVVLLGCHARRSCKADKDAHAVPPWSGGAHLRCRPRAPGVKLSGMRTAGRGAGGGE